MIIELDSVSNIRPETVFRFIPADPKHRIYSADEIDLGVGAYDDSRSFSDLSKDKEKFDLPKDTSKLLNYPTGSISVGNVSFVIPVSWQLNTSPPNPTNGISDYLYAIASPSGNDLFNLESDLPQLEITSEQLASTQSRKAAQNWIEIDDQECRSRFFFTYKTESFYIEWVVRLNCKVRDAFSDFGKRLSQTQAAPLIRMLVSEPLDASSEDLPKPLLRINFTPETQEDLLFLKEMVLSFRTSN